MVAVVYWLYTGGILAHTDWLGRLVQRSAAQNSFFSVQNPGREAYVRRPLRDRECNPMRSSPFKTNSWLWLYALYALRQENCGIIKERSQVK